MAQDISLTHRYIPKSDTRNRNLFKEEYYSGTDCKIRFAGEDQTEIASIAYVLQEQLLPIYGYASRTFDTLAVGNRIVNGQFRVTIRNPETQVSGNEIGPAIDAWDETSYANGVYEYNLSEQQKIINDESVGSRNNDTTVTKDNDTEKNNDNDKKDTSTIWINQDDKYMQMLFDLGGLKVTSNLTQDSLHRAVKNFQKKNDLQQTGNLDKDTKNKIEELYRKKHQQVEHPEDVDPNAITLPVNTPLFKSKADTEAAIIGKVVPTDGKVFSNVPSETDSDWLCVINNRTREKYYVKKSTTVVRYTPKEQRYTELIADPYKIHKVLSDGTKNTIPVNIEGGTPFTTLQVKTVTSGNSTHTFYQVSFVTDNKGGVTGWMTKSEYELMQRLSTLTKQ